MALAYHQPFQSVLNDYWYCTLHAFMVLEEVERIDALHEREAEFQRAFDLALAHNDPKRLAMEYKAFRQMLETNTDNSTGPSRAELRQAMQEMGKGLHRIVPPELEHGG